MANAMTRAMALEMAISVVTDEEAKAVLEKIKASIEKKNTSKSPRKVSDAQAWLRATIHDILAEAIEPLSVGEIIERIDKDSIPEELRGKVSLSTSSVTSNMGVSVRNGKVENPNGDILREMVGKTAKFSLIRDEIENEAEVEEE